jgi:hypothetical protein
MQKYINSEVKDITGINRGFKPIWKCTYKISGEEEAQVRVVNRDLDNLLLSWIPDERIHREELKASSMMSDSKNR